MKRSSTRNVVLSKAMKHVDEETRREFREKRLQALECDNYVEMEAAQQEDDAYNESEVSCFMSTLTF
jgi:zinc finger HIT domain-containing protein 1